MNELQLQDKFVIPFFRDTLKYKEVQANTVSNSLIIEADLQAFIEETDQNQKPYQALLRKFSGNREALLAELIDLIQSRSASSRNMALFINNNRTVTLRGVSLTLFYTSDSVLQGNARFEQNIFSVVQELRYKYEYQGQKMISIRPDISLFVNGIYLGYSELKSNFTNQSAKKNGRRKVIKDYFEAVKNYHRYIDADDTLTDAEKERYRRDLLKIFERAIHITTTDIGQTFVIRNLADFFTPLLETYREDQFNRALLEEEVEAVFKPYPLHNPDAEKAAKLSEIFSAHYSKDAIEKEILYYNFIEREVHKAGNGRALKGDGQLISPRPKQKFGTDKILTKIDEFLAHEDDDDYFLALLEKQLAGVSPDIREDLINKRRSYANNKNVYSLLMQYAAGFGKSNIIGWTALQLKDLYRDGAYVYDKIMIVVDRLQLRDQLDAKMWNMNIDKKLFIEAKNRKTFQEALASNTRIVIVNLQKFRNVQQMLDPQTLQRLGQMRTVFLIDEIHRSNSGEQHDDMINVFDILQTTFDKDSAYNQSRRKKNLIIGFTATPDENSLARFGEFSGYAESEKIWVPFDAYTMQEAIEDGYIHNPIKNIVPIASKMIFDLPDNKLKGFAEPEYKDADKKQIYENAERIDAIAAYIADLLVKDVYRQIRGQGKAMLAVHSIKAAISYYDRVKAHFQKRVQEKKYQRYATAPIYVVYSDNQHEQTASSLNQMSEQQVLEAFAREKNGLIIVVAKLQTGFDEKRLHTLFLDKEIRDINAIQTISRVNRTTKYKTDCKIVDFSYQNVNVQNIKDAFEHYSNIVVSDFDPHSDARVLGLLYDELRKSAIYNQFYAPFKALYQDDDKRDDPGHFLSWESQVEAHIQANPDSSADAKAKTSQYFTILNRIEYVISLDDKYSETIWLHFLRKYNTLYNQLQPDKDPKDPIEVYFDNQIGIIEAITSETQPKKRKEIKVAEARAPYNTGHPYSILDILEARNQSEEFVGIQIQEFKDKIDAFFQYVSGRDDGQRIIVKIKSGVTEDEICEDFGKLYRRYKLIDGKAAGKEFFARTDDLLDVLCRNFIEYITLQAAITAPPPSDDDFAAHPNIATLIRRMIALNDIGDYAGVLHASASIFETMAKDIVGLETITQKSLGSFFERYRKDSRLPNHLLDYILDVYRNRNNTPLAGHGSLDEVTLTAEEALTLIEMTKAFVRIEYGLRGGDS